MYQSESQVGSPQLGIFNSKINLPRITLVNLFLKI